MASDYSEYFTDYFDIRITLTDSKGSASAAQQSANKEGNEKVSSDALAGNTGQNACATWLNMTPLPVRLKPKVVAQQETMPASGSPASAAGPSSATSGSTEGKLSTDGKLGTASASNTALFEKRLEELTPAELKALAKGVRNEEGVMVTFLPSAIEDPWKNPWSY